MAYSSKHASRVDALRARRAARQKKLVREAPLDARSKASSIGTKAAAGQGGLKDGMPEQRSVLAPISAGTTTQSAVFNDRSIEHENITKANRPAGQKEIQASNRAIDILGLGQPIRSNMPASVSLQQQPRARSDLSISRVEDTGHEAGAITSLHPAGGRVSVASTQAASVNHQYGFARGGMPSRAEGSIDGARFESASQASWTNPGSRSGSGNRATGSQHTMGKAQTRDLASDLSRGIPSGHSHQSSRDLVPGGAELGGGDWDGHSWMHAPSRGSLTSAVSVSQSAFDAPPMLPPRSSHVGGGLPPAARGLPPASPTTSRSPRMRGVSAGVGMHPQGDGRGKSSLAESANTSMPGVHQGGGRAWKSRDVHAGSSAGMGGQGPVFFVPQTDDIQHMDPGRHTGQALQGSDIQPRRWYRDLEGSVSPIDASIVSVDPAAAIPMRPRLHQVPTFGGQRLGSGPGHKDRKAPPSPSWQAETAHDNDDVLHDDMVQGEEEKRHRCRTEQENGSRTFNVGASEKIEVEVPGRDRQGNARGEGGYGSGYVHGDSDGRAQLDRGATTEGGHPRHAAPRLRESPVIAPQIQPLSREEALKKARAAKQRQREAQDPLAFGRRGRRTEYRPKTLSEYKDKYAGEQSDAARAGPVGFSRQGLQARREPGGLGPDLDSDEKRAARARAQRAAEFAQRAKARNMRSAGTSSPLERAGARPRSHAGAHGGHGGERSKVAIGQEGQEQGQGHVHGLHRRRLGPEEEERVRQEAERAVPSKRERALAFARRVKGKGVSAAATDAAKYGSGEGRMPGHGHSAAGSGTGPAQGTLKHDAVAGGRSDVLVRAGARAGMAGRKRAGVRHRAQGGADVPMQMSELERLELEHDRLRQHM